MINMMVVLAFMSMLDEHIRREGCERADAPVPSRGICVSCDAVCSPAAFPELHSRHFPGQLFELHSSLLLIFPSSVSAPPTQAHMAVQYVASPRRPPAADLFSSAVHARTQLSAIASAEECEIMCIAAHSPALSACLRLVTSQLFCVTARAVTSSAKSAI